MGKIIAIASQKGGVGKTTTAINLGVSFSIFNKRTLIVDLDPQGSVAETFQISPYDIPAGILDIFKDKVPLSEAIIDIGLGNYEIVASNIKDEEDEVALYTYAFNLKMLKNILKPYKKVYDYILLDCPPNLGTLTMNGLIAADTVIIPVQCEFYALKSLGKFLQSIRNISKKHNPKMRIEGILITLFDKRLKKSREIADELKRSFKNLVFDIKIPRNAKVAEAPAYGKPVALYDINAPGAIAYLELAEKIISL